MRADTLREGGIADQVAECLSTQSRLAAERKWIALRIRSSPVPRNKSKSAVPFRLEFRVHFALGVIANVADVDIAPEIELLCTEMSHDGGVWAMER